jgi:F-type H+-transporting ATPase subunit b
VININVSLFVQLVNFILLLIILHFILYKPILNRIRQRQAALDADRQKAQELEDKVVQEEKRHQEEMSNARQIAAQDKAGLVAEAKQKESEILGNARAEANRIVEDMRSTIQSEAEEVRKTLRDQMTPLAQSIAEKILGRAV